MLRVTTQRHEEVDEELHVFFIFWTGENKLVTVHNIPQSFPTNFISRHNTVSGVSAST